MQYTLDEIFEYVAEGMALGAVSKVIGRDGDYVRYAYYGALVERRPAPSDKYVYGTIIDGSGTEVDQVLAEVPTDVPLSEAARIVAERWLEGEYRSYDEPDPDHYYDVDAESRI